jgi:hypothetical protein
VRKEERVNEQDVGVLEKKKKRTMERNSKS